jgi:hypothetical protein
LVVAVCTALSGCGYKLVRYEGALGDVDSVAIETLANESYEPGIEYIVADAFRREFLRRGAVRLTDDSSGADLVLSGSVLPVETAGLSLSSVVLVIEYQLTLSLAIQATRLDGVEVPIDSRALRESERYLVSGDVEATRKNREEALRRVAAVLAERVHDALAEVLTP